MQRALCHRLCADVQQSLHAGEVIALSKIDGINEKDTKDKIHLLEKKTGKKLFPISSVTNKGLEEILNTVLNVIETEKIKEDRKKWSP